MIRRGGPDESLAAAFLERQGLKILERNYRCRFGEIDLVAAGGAVLVFVEVRARRSDDFGGAGASITAPQRRRPLAHPPDCLAGPRGRRACRLDVVLVQAAP